MISVENTLKATDILLDLKSTDLKDAVAELAELLRNDRRIVDWDEFMRTLKAKGPCVVKEQPGLGVCIPHARTDAVQAMVMAVGRSNAGIAVPGASERIHYIFVVAIPHTLAAEYLRLIGSLVRVLKDPETEKHLRQSDTPEDFKTLLSQAETKI